MTSAARYFVFVHLLLLLLSVPRAASVGGNSRPSVSDMWEQGQITFGYSSRNDIFCSLFYSGEKRQSARSALLGLGESLLVPHSGFVPLPVDSLPLSVKEYLGDTLTMVWSGGTVRCVAEHAGILFGVCSIAPVYKLKAIDSFSRSLTGVETVLMLAQVVKLSSPVTVYSEYTVNGDDVKDFEDSVRGLVAHAQASFKGQVEDLRIEYRGVEGDTLPDTLFMTVHGWDGSMWCWHTVYLMERSGKTWRWSRLVDLNRGTCRFEIDCSFDLDEDGVSEYLIMWYAEAGVFSIVDGKMVMLVICYDYRGC